MRKIYILVVWVTLLSLISCSGFLDVEPKDKVTGDVLFTSDGGILSYMAGLYCDLPIEDYRYGFIDGFGVMRPGMGFQTMVATTEAVHSSNNETVGSTNRFNEWEKLYQFIRKFCELKDNIKFMKPTDPSVLTTIKGEYHFMMAYSYFALAKRYGGVPLVSDVLNFKGDYDALKIPRAKEVDTWKFILLQCDSAAMYLPNSTVQERANKWTAYALKSRVALHAASVGKYWNKDAAGLTGIAVTEGLVGGFTASDIAFFYQQCIDASAEVIKSGNYELYGENPATLSDVVTNYGKIFTDGVGMKEVLFVRRYTYPGFSHNMGKYQEPNQLSKDWGGRCDPTLDLVESYPVIDPLTRFGTYNVKIATTSDGNESYDGYNQSVNYKRYNNMNDIFANRDPRLYATVLLPNTQWGGQNIVIQGGIVKQDGSAIWKANDLYDFKGVKYYGKGDPDEGVVSGFITNRDNGTRSGFLLKKYLKGDGSDQTEDQVVTPFSELRYSEVLMNYAEAVAESGLPDASGVITAKEAMNKVRNRAGYLDSKELTPMNVRYERKAEFALEFNAVWDYWRRREFHTLFDNTRKRMGLVPMADFTTGELQYIFVRSNAEPDNLAKRFESKAYYRPIPGINNNSLIQNPNY